MCMVLDMVPKTQRTWIFSRLLKNFFHSECNVWVFWELFEQCWYFCMVSYMVAKLPYMATYIAPEMCMVLDMVPKTPWTWIFSMILKSFFSIQSAMYGCFKSFLSNVDIFASSAIWLPSYHMWQLTWHHKCAWSWIWFPRHHELEFFSRILKSFFPLRVQCMGVLRAFWAMLIFLHRQLYGCQVTIYGNLHGTINVHGFA